MVIICYNVDIILICMVKVGGKAPRSSQMRSRRDKASPFVGRVSGLTFNINYHKKIEFSTIKILIIV